MDDVLAKEIRYALILGHNRVDDLRETINGIIDQVDMLWVHDNASEPKLHDVLKSDYRDPPIVFVYCAEQPPNIARFWNKMLTQIDMYHIAAHGNEFPYKVAVLTDDLVIPENWFETVSKAMDDTGAAAGCTSGFEGRLARSVLKTDPDRDLYNRMYGPAFIVRGDAGLRANEHLAWWWNDTDMDWKARGAGGMVMAPGPYVHNKYPDASTVGELAEQAARDRKSFKEIWGWIPW